MGGLSGTNGLEPDDLNQLKKGMHLRRKPTNSFPQGRVGKIRYIDPLASQHVHVNAGLYDESLWWDVDCEQFEFVVQDNSGKIVHPGTVQDTKFTVGDNVTCNGRHYTVEAFSPGKSVTLKDALNGKLRCLEYTCYVEPVDSRRRLLNRF